MAAGTPSSGGAWASLVATGRYLPERLITNALLRERFEPHGRAHVIDRFEASSGIRQRWQARPEQTTSDLAKGAAEQALERAGWAAHTLDLILVGTDTPDQITPATATRLQAKLGATNAGTFDIGCACASFPTALATAAGMIAGNTGVRRVLVVGAYLMRRFAAADDPMTFFYGDGAGAALLTASPAPGLVAAGFRADGRYADYWGIPAGGAMEPPTASAVQANRTTIQMQRRYPPEVNEQGWPELAREVTARAGLTPQGLDLAIFTQINRGTIERVTSQLGIAPERAPCIMADLGYTGSACVPMALDHALGTGRWGYGEHVLLLGSGVGTNMAAVVLRLERPLPSGTA